MSEFPVEGGEMHTAMENFQKKNNLVTGRTHHVTHHPQVTTTSSQVIIFDTDLFLVFLSLTIKYLPDAARRRRDSLKDRKDASLVFPSLVFPQESILSMIRSEYLLLIDTCERYDSLFEMIWRSTCAKSPNDGSSCERKSERRGVTKRS